MSGKINHWADDAFGKEKVQFVGPGAKNSRAFKYYNPAREVAGKSMQDWFRFSMAYWHSMRGQGADPFGPGTAIRPWEATQDSIENAQNRIRVAFCLMEKLGLKHYCFHDTDLIPSFSSWSEYEKHIAAVMPVLKEEQARTGIVPLWATANLFSNPIYLHGAATGTDPKVFASAALQVQTAMNMGKELGALGYVCWGGREGYQNIWNTDLKRELANYARFFDMLISYADSIGFKGGIYIEPKPKEPTSHQYGHDVEAQLAFLLKHSTPELRKELGLKNSIIDRLGFNLEGNHVTLAGHQERHDIRMAAAAGKWASFDANEGDPLIGWDEDKFPTTLNIALDVMEMLLAQGGFTTGGFNFDAKVRRESHNPIDLVTSHVIGMDCYAFGLLAAEQLRGHQRYQQLLKERYSDWNTDLGKSITSGDQTLDKLAKAAAQAPMPAQTRSGGFEEIVSIRQQVLLDTAIVESRH